MASEMTSAFREFALKKLNEAKQRGATLATATAATAASITSNVPVPTSATAFGFRAPVTPRQSQEKEPLALDRKLVVLRETNSALQKTASDHATETLDDAIAKIDLVNDSLAYSIEQIQECAHVLKIAHRQLRDLGTLRNEADLAFYRPRVATATAATEEGEDEEDSADAAAPTRRAPVTSAERFAIHDGADYDY